MNSHIPLAERMRPQSLDTFIGQAHLVGEGKVLRQMILQQKAHSMILWGPPGVGKTTLAQIIAHTLGLSFYTLSAIDSGVKEVRAVIDLAKKEGKALLFIDELHRFNKAQQDSLLGAVEKGIITLIGATTENPSFEVISALLSRCQVYVLKALEEAQLKSIVQQALEQDVILKQQTIVIEEWTSLIQMSGGDARKLLNLLELVVASLEHNNGIITNQFVLDVVQQKMALYDKNGEQHYDIISAFIKSIRGSDPNAAIYWLARMIEGGEDTKFIARRMLILASEDIGNANPNALLLATSTFQAVEMIGYPECRIILAQTASYLASSAKSNASYLAIGKAQSLVQQTGDLPVPMQLRNAPTKMMKEMDYGKNYQYAHDFSGNFIEQEFLPESISNTKFYEPGSSPAEEKLRAYLRQCWKAKYNY
jgi:putative ATPase